MKLDKIRKGIIVSLISVSAVIVTLCVVFICLMGFGAFKRLTVDPLISQPNTTWVSEDGSIYLYVESDKNGNDVLHLDKDGDKTDFALFGDNYSIILCDVSILPEDPTESVIIDTGEILEDWDAKFKTNKRFVIEVKKSTLFKEGEIIKFYRVDE